MRAWIIAAALLLPVAALADETTLAKAYQLCQAQRAPRNTFRPGFEKCADVVTQYLTQRGPAIDAQPKAAPPDTAPAQDLVNKAVEK